MVTGCTSIDLEWVSTNIKNVHQGMVLRNQDATESKDVGATPMVVEVLHRCVGIHHIFLLLLLFPYLFRATIQNFLPNSSFLGHPGVLYGALP